MTAFSLPRHLRQSEPLGHADHQSDATPAIDEGRLGSATTYTADDPHAYRSDLAVGKAPLNNLRRQNGDLRSRGNDWGTRLSQSGRTRRRLGAGTYGPALHALASILLTWPAAPDGRQSTTRSLRCATLVGTMPWNAARPFPWDSAHIPSASPHVTFVAPSPSRRVL